jgi:glyoxylase-like metal-dependent hydrolase (beta-lactamase superfamily II)
MTPHLITEGTEQLLSSVHVWLAKTPHGAVLIDAGIGNGKPRPTFPPFHMLRTKFLEHLTAAGVEPADVRHVLITHVHTDHVGWNTVLVDDTWQPTFANATYHIPKAGCDFFSSPEGSARPNADMFRDSVVPVLNSGQAELVPRDGHDVLGMFRYHPTVGHSIDHMSIVLRSKGSTGFFAGDVMHHPIQFHKPEWSSVYCASHEEAESSRRWAMDYCLENNAIFFSSHFTSSSVCRLKRLDDAVSFEFV